MKPSIGNLSVLSSWLLTSLITIYIGFSFRQKAGRMRKFLQMLLFALSSSLPKRGCNTLSWLHTHSYEHTSFFPSTCFEDQTQDTQVHTSVMCRESQKLVSSNNCSNLVMYSWSPACCRVLQAGCRDRRKVPSLFLYAPDSCGQVSTVGLCYSRNSRGRAFLSDLYFHGDVALC